MILSEYFNSHHEILLPKKRPLFTFCVRVLHGFRLCEICMRTKWTLLLCAELWMKSFKSTDEDLMSAYHITEHSSHTISRFNTIKFHSIPTDSTLDMDKWVNAGIFFLEIAISHNLHNRVAFFSEFCCYRFGWNICLTCLKNWWPLILLPDTPNFCIKLIFLSIVYTHMSTNRSFCIASRNGLNLERAKLFKLNAANLIGMSLRLLGQDILFSIGKNSFSLVAVAPGIGSRMRNVGPIDDSISFGHFLVDKKWMPKHKDYVAWHLTLSEMEFLYGLWPFIVFADWNWGRNQKCEKLYATPGFVTLWPTLLAALAQVTSCWLFYLSLFFSLEHMSAQWHCTSSR